MLLRLGLTGTGPEQRLGRNEGRQRGTVVAQSTVRIELLSLTEAQCSLTGIYINSRQERVLVGRSQLDPVLAS